MSNNFKFSPEMIQLQLIAKLNLLIIKKFLKSIVKYKYAKSQ